MNDPGNPKNWQAREPNFSYVTPKSPRRAVLNALLEIDKCGITDHDGQAQVILYHLRDYDSGKIMLALYKNRPPKEVAKAIQDLWVMLTTDSDGSTEHEDLKPEKAA